MTGRSPKPQISSNRAAALEKLKGDIFRFHSHTAREAAEKKFGGPIVEGEPRLRT